MDLTFSVVIPTYNGREFLRKTLLVLRRSTLQPVKVIVVDDFSSDETSEMVEREFPEVMLIRNERNLGPVFSRNRGAQHAEGKYLVFLDNDVLIRPSAIQKLLTFLETHPDAGIAGGKLITEQGKTMWWNMGWRPNNLREGAGFLIGLISRLFFPKWKAWKEFSMRFTLNYWGYDRTIVVGWVIEAFFAVPKALFERVGGLDKEFFMFFEGVDLSDRLREIGYQTYFVCNAEADVLESHTHTTAVRAKHWIRSKRRYYAKYYYPLRSNPFFLWFGTLIRKVFYRKIP